MFFRHIRPIKHGIGHGLQNGVIVGFPFREISFKRGEIKISLIANGKRIESIRIFGCDVAGQPR